MIIKRLDVIQFRNLMDVNLLPSPTLNILAGLNGSGKTSLLEAVHYLGLGRSFRTRNIKRLINDSADTFTLLAHLSPQESNGILPVALERGRDNQTTKIGGKVVNSHVEIAKLLPLQLINAHSHHLLTSGPLTRRQFLDWGVFHVEPLFYPLWQRTNRILKQRNACLKMGLQYKEVSIWDAELDACAMQLNQLRLNYVSKFKTLHDNLLYIFLSRSDLALNYQPGWDIKTSLAETLKTSYQKDLQLGYTQRGPHRADLQLKINNIPAVEIFSQGQQKLAAYAFKIAQGQLLEQATASRCVFLIDDLPSELDKGKRALVSELLLGLASQLFITGIAPDDLEDLTKTNQAKMFHVEHGGISHLG